MVSVSPHFIGSLVQWTIHTPDRSLARSPPPHISNSSFPRACIAGRRTTFGAKLRHASNSFRACVPVHSVTLTRREFRSRFKCDEFALYLLFIQPFVN